MYGKKGERGEVSGIVCESDGAIDAQLGECSVARRLDGLSPYRHDIYERECLLFDSMIVKKTVNLLSDRRREPIDRRRQSGLTWGIRWHGYAVLTRSNGIPAATATGVIISGLPTTHRFGPANTSRTKRDPGKVVLAKRSAILSTV